MSTSRYPDINRIFDELDAFLEFCKEFGHVYNEKDLYNYKSVAYNQYDRWRKGHRVINNWKEDQVNVILN